MGDDSSGGQGIANFPALVQGLATKVTSPHQSYVKKHLQHQGQRRSLMLFPGNPLGPRVLHPSCRMWFLLPLSIVHSLCVIR